MIGRTLGPYHVIDKLGQGGMGEVYRARDTRLKREVALKVLPQSLSSDPDRIARFAREAEMLAALNHPNIAAIYGIEEVQEATAGGGAVRAIVMELVGGETLAARIARGAIPVDEALSIARQIAEALEAAHEQGIIHRDLKPANVTLRPDGTLKVLDFGLARAIDVVPASAGTNVTMSPTVTSPAMTQAGIILGTAAYMSPEQARGKAVDRRADIWSFGVVLFEMLTGSRPFPGEETSDVLASVLAREPQFDRLPADVPPSVRQILKASLQKDPRRRLHHMGDVRLLLDGAFDVPAESRHLEAGRSPAARWKRAAALAALAAVGVALGGAAGWSLRPATPAPSVSFVHPLGEQRFTRPGRTLLSISPDGTLAYVADGQIYRKSRQDLVAQPIQGTAGEDPASPSFSPDGRSLAYWADAEIRRIPVEGGTPVRLASALIPTGLSWGADGTIVYAQNDGIWRVTDRGTDHEQIIVAGDGERMHAPQMLPDDDAVLFSVTREAGADAWDEASIVVESLRTHQRTPVHRGAHPMFVPATGHLLYVTGQTLFGVRFDPETLKTEGAPIALVPGIQRSMGPPSGLGQYAISPGGALAYVGRSIDTPINLEIIARSGASRVLPNSSGPSLYPRLSPDESRIAVQRGTGARAQIWLYDIGRSVWEVLTDGERPLWNPMTREVTFLRDDELWEISIGGTARRLPGTKVARNRGPYDWSPRGDVLLYGSPGGVRAFYPGRATTAVGTPSEMVMAPEGNSADYVFARFSADGRAFVFVAVDESEGVPVLHVAPYPFVPGSDRRLPFTGAVGPTWSRHRNGSARELFVVRGNLLFAMPITETSPVPRLLNAAPAFTYALSRVFSEGGSPNFDVMSDGQILTTTATPATEISVILNWVETLRRDAEDRVD